MRLKIASVLLLAGTVVGCASNPPPPPPPAPMPAPMPAPAPAPQVMAPMNGTYKGMAETTGHRCRAPHGMQMARVRGMNIMVAGMHGKIDKDGTVMGRNLSGTVNGGSADLTVKRGRCSYHYTLSHS
jgi:hypothetical protein